MSDYPSSMDMLRRLIALDTTSRNSNLVLIDFVRNHLAQFGVDSELIFDTNGGKANLYATIGPVDRPGICLSGHTDVVPIDGQEWTTDPWTLIERDGLLFGRGSCDMKGFLAVVLTWVERFSAAGLKKPAHLLFSYDEEVGCRGVRGALERLKQLPIMPSGCIVGEPTEMRVVTGHKGKKSIRCHVHGHECHSSAAPKGVNAVEYASELIVYLKGIAQRLAREGPFDCGFDVPHTTVHTGVVTGGTAINIVPKDCRFEFEFRYLPGEDPDALLAEVQRYAATKLIPEMRVVAPEAGCSWQSLSAYPGLNGQDDDGIAVVAKALTLSQATTKVSFGTEAGLIEQAGIPAVVCGPGSIDQAHKPDEFVAISQLKQCEAFMDRLVVFLSRH